MENQCDVDAVDRVEAVQDSGSNTAVEPAPELTGTVAPPSTLTRKLSRITRFSAAKREGG